MTVLEFIKVAYIQILVCLIIFICWILMLYIVFHLSKVKDTIEIRREYVYVASFGIAFGVSYFILWTTLHDWNSTDTEQDNNNADVLYLIIPSTFLYAMILVQTKWVLYKMRVLHQIKHKREHNINDENITLKTIISDLDGYKEFMEFLVKFCYPKCFCIIFNYLYIEV